MCSNCDETSLDTTKIKGKIVICENDDHDGAYAKMNAVKSLGGIGVIVVDDKSRAVAENYLEFPATVISSKDSKTILAYLNSTRYLLPPHYS